MPRPSPQPACNTPPTERLVCAGCGLLCDDLDPSSLTTTSWACPAAERWFTAADTTPAITAIDGVPTTPPKALDLAVHRLLTARRVLVTGLTAAPLEALQPACQIADLLAAAIDAGGSDTAVPTGPTFARVGEVTAAFEELRNRADLIIFWNCDPAATHPRFIERFVQPARPAGSRQTISLGPHPVMPASASHLHFALTADETLPAARLLQTHLHQHPTDLLEEPLATVVPKLAAAIDAAECVGIVTSTQTDSTGLTAWSLATLVRMLAHRKPTFQIPLGAGIAAGGGNAAGVAASCTWRYGAPGALAAADRQGSLFQPAEADAVRLVSRGEVDCVMAIGRLTATIEAALATAAPPPALIHITDVAPSTPAAENVVLATASLARATSGTMLREDGRLIPLTPLEPATHPTLEDLLTTLAERLAEHPPAGGAE